MKRKKHLIGHIAVDAGLCWVGDPCYIIHTDKVPSELGKNWGEFCNILHQNEHFQLKEFDRGIVVETGYGDGEYPVYATYSEDGRVASVTVKFI